MTTRTIVSSESHPAVVGGGHKAYMEYALSRARLSPQAPTKFCVAAVLVDPGKNEILSTGYSMELPGDRPRDPGNTRAEHCCLIEIAERHGLLEDRIMEVLSANTVLYTTMEPCSRHLGGNRTCVDRILGLDGAVKSVYVGIREPDTFIGENGGIQRLENAGGGGSASYFIKAISGDVGRSMTRSEFESMSSIYEPQPGFVPKPSAHGNDETIPDTHFFPCEFREMSATMPDPREFYSRLAALHQSSKSPNGKFGCHLATYSGNLPQMTEWEASWEAFFTKSLRFALDLELAAKGPNPEFDVLLPLVFDTVIPRLLRPLESEGQSAKPCLVHGDVWHANSGVDVESGESLVFDACCFYTHDEYEFCQRRPACNRFGPEYLDAYHGCVQISAPEEDYEGQLDLYKL
ncbi:cytidine deaminase-like protein [Xylaria acuta]|nr:cytidine deaminase-like protein [Xylaria acuta]